MFGDDTTLTFSACNIEELDMGTDKVITTNSEYAEFTMD